MKYQKQTVEGLHDNELYWVRYKQAYMDLWGRPAVQYGATIKMQSHGMETDIQGPVDKPEGWE